MAQLTTLLVDVVGGKTAKALAGLLKIERPTVLDLLQNYPRRLVERGELTDLASLREGDDVTVMAEVQKCSVRTFGRPGKKGLDSRIEAVVSDGRSTLQLAFFGRRNSWRSNELKPGTRALFAGKVGSFRNQRQLVHPEYVLLDGPGADFGGVEATSTAAVVDHFAGALIALYPANKDLRSWTVARAVRLVLDSLDPIEDPLPEAIRVELGLRPLDEALRAMHRPESWADWNAARHRLKWDEALGVQLALAQRRAAAAVSPATARPGAPADWLRPSMPRCRSCSPRARPRSAPRWPMNSRARTRCTGCCRARSVRARRSWPCGPCCR